MTTSPSYRRYRWATRALAVIATVLTVIGIGIATPVDAYAASYGVSLSASSTYVPVGTAVSLVATNQSSVDAWVTICTGFGGSLLAQGYHSPGTSTNTSVSKSTPGTYQYAAFVPHESSCTESYNSSVSITWYQPTTSTTTTTTTAPAAVYGVNASAANSKPAINTEDLITATNTGGQSEYISLCIVGSDKPIAEGYHPAGGSLTHDVTSSTATDQTYVAYGGPSYGCGGPSQSSVTISWQNAVTVTASPTSAGTTSGVKNSTTISWDEAKTGDTLKVVETSRNGTAEFVTKQTTAMSSYSGSETFSATETTTAGTQWVNDYKAVMYSSAGTVLTYAEFSFTWSGTSCTTDQVNLATNASSTGLVVTAKSPICLPKGTNDLEVYWSADKPAPGQTIPLLTEVGSCTVGTGPTTLLSTKTCDFTPAAPYNTGYFEAYLIEDYNGSKIVVACSSNVELSTTASGTVYKLTLATSNASPTIGQTITLTTANDSTNPEWLNFCGSSGTQDLGAAYKDSGQDITHSETSSVAGDVTYESWASGSEACSGTSAKVTVDWQAPTSTSSPQPALIVTATNLEPTVGQTDTIVVTNTSSSTEWLDYCGTTGDTLTAAGTHAPNGALDATVSSPSSAGDVTYYGWAGTSEGCSTVEASVTVDWQAAATTTTTTAPSGNTGTTTTTTTAPSGNTGTTTTTTTAPSSTTTTTAPTTTTTVPATTGTSGPPQYYPTAVYWGRGSAGGTVLDVASRRVRQRREMPPS